ncbi:MAG: maleylpyruvate isomerase family mycothiol-dependent enzyme [Hamadaea sp.]|uniref:maleylpyruvate isomerase family mycothiol-dependent enzyme n=1 Tax=Hamadaea sp. TaxID=2024425 RepID=UPI0017A92FEE|nr:maleylpyruvate isomerase family mycothiol-dependent enzyme [Hamadaea sp.]NUT20604.1 maleylpyruvate isomerase family mycothiol-dependent enzyme [Hamadaea sp.]
MRDDEIWREVDAQRLDLAGLLAGLTPEQWERPSLCPGWRVRDVAAHLTLGPITSWGTVLQEIVRARGSFNRMVYDTAVRRADRPTAQIVADLRAISGSRRLAPGTTIHEPLLDILVHGQDIAIPLGVDRKMPADAAVDAATRVWSKGFPFGARRRLRGFRLVATDATWSDGDGVRVEGPISALLLVLTGRPAGLRPLGGPGLPELKRSFEGES